MGDSPFVDISGKGYDGKRVHKYWWTFVPVLPLSAECAAYKRLKRVWFDHTETGSNDTLNPYNETHEVHLVIALFENWALFADGKNYQWAEDMLSFFGVETFNIKKVGWSYQFNDYVTENGEPKKKSPGEFKIADIVFWYKDDLGEGVFVIEAKKKGGKIEKKDEPNSQRYLDVSAIKPFERREYRLLIDKSDIAANQKKVRDLSSHQVLTWQEMGKMQTHMVDRLDEHKDIKEFIKVALSRRYQHYRILGASDLPPLPDFNLVRNPQTQMFLTAAAVFEEVKEGILPNVPLSYIGALPECRMTCQEIRLNCKDQNPVVLKQSTGEREEMLWRQEAP
jgi:hypothetical protein